MGGDVNDFFPPFYIVLFQSTPPVWVVTCSTGIFNIRYLISIHTTRVGGDPKPHSPSLPLLTISIHTTRVGGDLFCFQPWIFILEFQSTPPVWVVTMYQTRHRWKRQISIHTTRVGGDSQGISFSSRKINFNPHHPCGWWRTTSCINHYYRRFQSTPPVWVVTSWLPLIFRRSKFQSTPPVWVVTLVLGSKHWSSTISIHTTRVGGDMLTYLSLPQSVISIHTTRVGGDRFAGILSFVTEKFQSTPPVWVVTYEIVISNCFCNYFNPHHPCGWWLISNIEII